MTREKAISWLVSLTEHEGEDIPIYDTDVEALNMAIKALEQESILDNIRAEIDEVYEELDGYDPDSLGTFACRIDEILDKHKADRSKE